MEKKWEWFYGIILFFSILSLVFLPFSTLFGFLPTFVKNYSLPNLSNILDFASLPSLTFKLMESQDKAGNLLSETEKKINSLLTLQNLLKEQLSYTEKFSQITNNEITLLKKTIPTLSLLKKQTSYTSLLVKRTLNLSKKTEGDTKDVYLTSEKLKKESELLIKTSLDIEKEMKKSIKNMKELNKKLPKNLPL
jgi:hypothetical protein